jgi:Holliday junction resolvasome RuvABC DNA-binding subunit
MNLGYPRAVAEKAVATAAKNEVVAGDFEKLFRAAMSSVK